MKKYLPPLLVFSALTVGILAVLFSTPTEPPTAIKDAPAAAVATDNSGASFLLERFQLQQPDAATVIEYQCTNQIFYMSATSDGRTHHYFDMMGDYVCTKSSSNTAQTGTNCGVRFKVSGCTATLLWPQAQ